MGIFRHCSVRCSLLECNEAFLLARAPAYTCDAGWTGTANHSCMIDRSDGKCAVPVPLGQPFNWGAAESLIWCGLYDVNDRERVLRHSTK